MAKGFSCHLILLIRLAGNGDKRKELAIAGYPPIGVAPHSVATKLFAIEMAKCCLLCTKT